MVAGEVRGAQWASIVASVGINDSRRGTRGQLVGGTVEVQLAENSFVLGGQRAPVRKGKFRDRTLAKAQGLRHRVLLSRFDVTDEELVDSRGHPPTRPIVFGHPRNQPWKSLKKPPVNHRASHGERKQYEKVERTGSGWKKVLRGYTAD